MGGSEQGADLATDDGHPTTRPARLGRSQEAYDRFAAATSLPMMVAAIVWLPILVLPYLASLTPSQAAAFAAVDYTIWALFAVEYLVKLWLSPSRSRFVRTHKLDLGMVVFPIFRPLVVLRVARAGVMVGEATSRARRLLTHKGIHYVVLTVGLLVFAGAALVTAAERHARGSNIHDFGSGLWWAMVTVTTVGYGDKYPVTPEGRGVAVALMLVGVGLIGVLGATVASFFIEQGQDRAEARLAEMAERLARIEHLLATPAGGDTAQGDDGRHLQHPARRPSDGRAPGEGRTGFA